MTSSVASSAKVHEIQTPSRPRKIGRMRIDATPKTSVRRLAINAETRPLFNAVNNDEP